MKSFRNIPIKRQLTIISLLTSSVALLLACSAIVGFQLVNFRHNMLRQVNTTAAMVGDNTSAALAFGEPASAEQTLKSLAADEHVSAAFIYDAEGKPFAGYQPAGAAPLAPPPLRRNFQRFTDDWSELFGDRYAHAYLEVFRDITAAGEPVGTIYLRHDMTELRHELSRSGYLALTVMGAAALVVFLLTRKFLPWVAGPIVRLEQVVRDVATRKDFSIRAVKQGGDEVGRLIDGFNEMLGEIQQRDGALLSARQDLEQRVAERTAELANSLAVLNATLNSTADGILAMDLTGEVVCLNSKFSDIWGMPADLVRRKDRAEMIAFASSKVSDPEQFLSGTEHRSHDRPSDVFDVIEMKDGRTIERYVHPQLTDGERVGSVVNIRDVTGRKRDEAKLELAARQLLETSRQAGMAEVATSVLHNVGNVLNSVNVSCSVVADRVRRSRVGSVAKTAALLDRQAADLAAFLTTDPTGRKLPAYLGKLADQLADERVEILGELQLLARNIDHIKDIVAMQQNYAKVSGVTETMPVADLVEDSLRMNEGSLAKHSVEVVREYAEVPWITVEKHKALQILVNLIRNAKHACDNSGRTDKRVILRVATGPDCVRVSVIDNGVGIPPENLDRIFAHGFTTKTDGHGFGLHSGALAAREMGGSLKVSSAGEGTGATFTLELPATPPVLKAKA